MNKTIFMHINGEEKVLDMVTKLHMHNSVICYL